MSGALLDVLDVGKGLGCDHGKVKVKVRVKGKVKGGG
jgi:hypothetical protein